MNERPRSTADDTRSEVKLRLRYLDPWSVVQVAALVAAVLAVLVFVAITVGWAVLLQSHVLVSIDKDLEGLVTVPGDGAGGLTALVPTAGVVQFAAVSALVLFVVGSALGGIGAVLCNLAMQTTGGPLIRLGVVG